MCNIMINEYRQIENKADISLEIIEKKLSFNEDLKRINISPSKRHCSLESRLARRMKVKLNSSYDKLSSKYSKKSSRPYRNLHRSLRCTTYFRRHKDFAVNSK